MPQAAQAIWVKKFYRLHSKTVHGQITGKSEALNDMTCAVDGLDICARLISDIVENGKLPKMDDLELDPARDRNG
jgi:hypothetical protein